MSRKALTVAKLANEAGVDLDEALVTLWDAGIEEVDEPSSLIPARKLTQARRALRLPTRREFRAIDSLAELAGLNPEETRDRLLDAGVIKNRNENRLPKGSVKKARRVLDISAAAFVSPVTASTVALVEPTEQVREEFKWHVIGIEEEIQYLSTEDVCNIHHALVDDFARSGDPIFPPGVRDDTLLESAVFRPHTGLGAKKKYPTVCMAGGALFHSLALNHAFHNGNKRTAVVALLVFLDKNGYVLDVSENELFRYVLLVAQHRVVPRNATELADREALAIAVWILTSMRKVKKDELPIRWTDLKKILAAHECTSQVITGNRINIERTIPRSRRFGRERVLKTQVFYARDGQEAEPNTIHKLRRDLHLDEEHGVDSEVFYRGRPVIDVFIAKYRKTLARLARL